MTSSRRRRRGPTPAVLALALGAALVALGVVPAVASAHEVGATRFDAPLPLSLLFVGAGATVAATAAWLGIADRSVPTGRRRLLTVSRSVASAARTGARWLFLVLVAVAVVDGVAGRRVAAENLATTFVWPVWFHGLALLSILAGSPWATLSPWRTIYRGLARLEGRSFAVAGSLPERVGTWPATVGFAVLLGVGENLTVLPRSPRLTTVVVAGYALAMVGGAVLFGPPWLRRADPLAVLYRLLGRVAPVTTTAGDDGAVAVEVRPPWTGCLAPVSGPGTVAFVVAALYTVSFDGFASTRAYQATLFAARDVLGVGSAAGLVLYPVGLAAFLASFGVVATLVEFLGVARDGATDSDAAATADWRGATLGFAPTLLPIAAAYEVAHVYPFVVGNLGRLLGLLARPVVPGADPVSLLWWLSLPAFWASQVVLIVLGHVVAVVAAHRVARDRYESARAARRGHLPLVALMVGYTALSLWLVSAPVVSG